MRAILSDIHGNLEALTAVLADIERQGVDHIYYLGDTFGYGPNPLECLDLTMAMTVSLMGNFDYATLTSPDGFCRTSRDSILWGQSQLSATVDPELLSRRQTFLRDLPRSLRVGRVLYVHGSASQPTNEYVFPEDVYNPKKMARIDAAFDAVFFCGHTAMPGLFEKRVSGEWEYTYADQLSREYVLGGSKLICNVGSVGQPRDGDPRAGYVLFDDERIWFRRIEYDMDTTIRKIYAIPELDNFCGDRLREGR